MAKALDRDIRRLLDRAVRKARIVAEYDARKALTEIELEDVRRPEGVIDAAHGLNSRLQDWSRLSLPRRKRDIGKVASRGAECEFDLVRKRPGYGTELRPRIPKQALEFY